MSDEIHLDDVSQNKKKKYNPRPMTLYVTTDGNGISEIDLSHIGVEAERIIDVQLTEYDAKKLYDLLRRKLSVEVYGGISFRLRGRLVL